MSNADPLAKNRLEWSKIKKQKRKKKKTQNKRHQIEEKKKKESKESGIPSSQASFHQKENKFF